MFSDPFFQGGRFFSKNSHMQAGGLTAVLHMPPALKSKGEGAFEEEQGLPPYAPRAAFQVDNLKGAPSDWVRSDGLTQSYAVPVKDGHGLWLDFNSCYYHSHDVAIVVSTQGVNAVTGSKTDHLRFEQYRNNCPKHNLPFLNNGRRCEQCTFDCPEQNYLASTGTPRGLLWLDGWRTADGTVRQWAFTADESRSVAKAIIGEQRVHALGIAFYLSKKPKRIPDILYSTRGGSGLEEGLSMSKGMSMGPVAMRGCSPGPVSTKLEVAAGAKIRQKVYPDTKDISYWQDTPAGIIVINYVPEEYLLEILQAGVTETASFLSEARVPVGN